MIADWAGRTVAERDTNVVFRLMGVGVNLGNVAFAVQLGRSKRL